MPKDYNKEHDHHPAAEVLVSPFLILLLRGDKPFSALEWVRGNSVKFISSLVTHDMQNTVARNSAWLPPEIIFW